MTDEEKAREQFLQELEDKANDEGGDELVTLLKNHIRDRDKEAIQRIIKGAEEDCNTRRPRFPKTDDFRRKHKAEVLAQFRDWKGPFSPYYIGLDGIIEDFRQAYKASISRINRGDARGEPEKQELQRGAIDAFLDGRIEKVQDMMLNPAAFSAQKQYTIEEDADTPKILSALIKGSDNVRAAAIIDLALAEIPDQPKHKFLNGLLCNVLASEDYRGATDFVAALLKTGAKANTMTKSGFPGLPLARAIQNSQPLSVIKLLYAHGANFHDTEFLMNARNWQQENKDRLELYKREMAKEAPATPQTLPKIAAPKPPKPA